MFVVLYERNEKRWRTKVLPLFECLDLCKALKKRGIPHQMFAAHRSLLQDVSEDPLLKAWLLMLQQMEQLMGLESTQGVK